MNSENSAKRIIAILKLAVLIFIIAGIPAVLYFKYGAGIFSSDILYRFEAYIRAHKSHAISIIIIAQILQVIICVLPGQPIQFTASYFFGIPVGFLLSIIGAVIGTTISFFLAKVLGRDFLYVVFSREQIDDYRNKLNSGKGLMIVLLLYLVPGLPKDLVSYAAGISDMRFRTFLLTSTVGRSPGMLGSLLFGHFFGARNYTAIIVLAVITVILLLFFFIKRRSIMGLLDRLEAREEIREEMRKIG